MSPDHPSRPAAAAKRLLISAGPTHEPIDSVRFLGNRSSGRLGIALADAAAGLGWSVTLMLGPTALTPSHTAVRLIRFQTTTDLQALLAEHVPRCDCLVMAAAVADFRPRPADPAHDGKLKRGDQSLVLHLEPTPDLLAGVAEFRRPDQLIVGFALEPRQRLLESARSKLARKRLDLIVANPLETMDAPTIEATVLDASGIALHTAAISKTDFALRLLDLLATRLASNAKP